MTRILVALMMGALSLSATAADDLFRPELVHDFCMKWLGIGVGYVPPEDMAAIAGLYIGCMESMTSPEGRANMLDSVDEAFDDGGNN